MSLKVDFDPAHLIALGVPGAIAGDYLEGTTADILLGAFASMTTGDYIQVNEENSHGTIRRLFRTMPLLGLGTGYLAARMGGLDPGQALLPGALGAAVAIAVTKNQKGGSFGLAPAQKVSDVQAYAHVPTDGGPPAAPGSIFPFV